MIRSDLQLENNFRPVIDSELGSRVAVSLVGTVVPA